MHRAHRLARSPRRRGLPVITALALAIAPAAVAALPAPGALAAQTVATAPPATGAYDYAEALQDSMFFCQAQRSGILPPTNEVSWRGDSDRSDGSDHGVNLTGGYHDAGDLVKFGLPEAWAMNMLAWGLLDYKQGYVQAGQYQTALDNLRWGDDYIIAAHPSASVFYGQVADPNTDHTYWGPAETNPLARPSYSVTSSCPGSDLVGQASAALAASSIVFKTADPHTPPSSCHRPSPCSRSRTPRLAATRAASPRRRTSTTPSAATGASSSRPRSGCTGRPATPPG